MKRLISVVLACAAAGCQGSGGHGPTGAKTPPPVPVEVALCQKTDVTRTLELPADVKARKLAKIYARVPGTLKELPVNLGDRVSRGQVLAVLDTPELERQALSAQASLSQAQSEAEAAHQQVLSQQSEVLAASADSGKARAQVEEARSQVSAALAQAAYKRDAYQRLRKVAQEDAGLIARQQLEQAWSELRLAQAQVASARQREQAARLQQQSLAQHWQASRRQGLALGSRAVSLDNQAEARRQEALRATDWRDYALLRAPFAGVVSQRLLDLGGLAGSNVPVVEICEDSVVTVSVRIPELEAPLVHAGTGLEIECEALPDEHFSGRVTRVSGALDVAGDRAMLSEADLPNPQRKLKPGMFVNAILSLGTHPGVVAAPTAAVLMEKGKPSVFVVADNRVTKKPVKVGFQNRRWTEISEGLSGGETLVTKGKEKLVNGSLVRI